MFNKQVVVMYLHALLRLGAARGKWPRTLHTNYLLEISSSHQRLSRSLPCETTIFDYLYQRKRGSGKSDSRINSSATSQII